MNIEKNEGHYPNSNEEWIRLLADTTPCYSTVENGEEVSSTISSEVLSGGYLKLGNGWVPLWRVVL